MWSLAGAPVRAPVPRTIDRGVPRCADAHGCRIRGGGGAQSLRLAELLPAPA
jgi:hypothetical protein